MIIQIVISGVLLIIAQERFVGIFYEKRRTSLQTYILSCLIALGFFLFIIWGHNIIWGLDEKIRGISRVMYLSFPAFIISLNYKSLLVKRLAVASCSFLVITISNSLAYVIFYTLLYFGLVHSLVWNEIIALVLAILTTVLLRLFKSIKTDSIELPMFWIPAIIVPIIYMVGEVLEMVLPLDNILFSFVGTMVASGSVLLIFLTYNTLSSAYRDKLSITLNTQEKDYYYTQCQLMQESVENIKSIRHDMKLHLATARDFNANNKIDEATAYLNSLLDNIEKNEIYSNTKNIAFDSIINFKLNTAKQDNIKLDIRLLIPPVINIEAADIVTILGNLLDNAIDAVSSVEEKAIKLYIEYSKENLFIQVENTFDGVVKYSKDAKETDGDKKRILTRKSGGEHGHGLNNIRKSVEKYNGHIDISHDDNVFSVGVMLYVEDV